MDWEERQFVQMDLESGLVNRIHIEMSNVAYSPLQDGAVNSVYIPRTTKNFHMWGDPKFPL